MIMKISPILLRVAIAAMGGLALTAAAGCSGSSTLVKPAPQVSASAQVSSDAQIANLPAPKLIPPKLPKTPLPDQTSRAWGEMPAVKEGPRLSEMVSTAEVVFLGTVTEVTEPAFLLDGAHPARDSYTYQDVTFDVAAYYRNDASAGPRVSIKIMTYGAQIPAVLLEEERRGKIELGKLLPDQLMWLQFGNLYTGVAGMGPEASLMIGEKAVVFARRSECTVVRKHLTPRYIPCMRPALGPYGIFDNLLPTVRGNFQSFGRYELFTDQVPEMVAQWPRKD